MPKVTSLPADDSSCGWFDLSRRRKPTNSHVGHTEAPWVIVGAGFTGLAAARQLAIHFPDDEIIVLDAQEVGYGASGRNAGFALDLPHDIRSSDYIGDKATARMVLKLNRTGQERLRSVVEEQTIDCHFQSIGKYQAAVEPRGLAALTAYRRGLDKLGEPYDLIDEKKLPDHIGTSFYRKALFTPGTVLLQPSALVKGLADTLPPNVKLFERTPINMVEYAAKTVLTHANGRISAKKLLLANNAFGAEFGLLQRTMLPIFTYASLTRQLNQSEQALLGGKPAWGLIPADPFGSTLRRTHDNRILVRNSLF